MPSLSNWEPEAGKVLKRAGADFLLICTNSMHKVADVVAEKVGLPLLHIVNVTGRAITEHGLRKVGLLRNSRFLLESHGVSHLAKRFASLTTFLPIALASVIARSSRLTIPFSP